MTCRRETMCRKDTTQDDFEGMVVMVRLDQTSASVEVDCLQTYRSRH